MWELGSVVIGVSLCATNDGDLLRVYGWHIYIFVLLIYILRVCQSVTYLDYEVFSIKLHIRLKAFFLLYAFLYSHVKYIL